MYNRFTVTLLRNHQKENGRSANFLYYFPIQIFARNQHHNAWNLFSHQISQIYLKIFIKLFLFQIFLQIFHLHPFSHFIGRSYGVMLSQHILFQIIPYRFVSASSICVYGVVVTVPGSVLQQLTMLSFNMFASLCWLIWPNCICLRIDTETRTDVHRSTVHHAWFYWIWYSCARLWCVTVIPTQRTANSTYWTIAQFCWIDVYKYEQRFNVRVHSMQSFGHLDRWTNFRFI